MEYALVHISINFSLICFCYFNLFIILIKSCIIYAREKQLFCGIIFLWATEGDKHKLYHSNISNNISKFWKIR
jgi:hypothetical protein